MHLCLICVLWDPHCAASPASEAVALPVSQLHRRHQQQHVHALPSQATSRTCPSQWLRQQPSVCQPRPLNQPLWGCCQKALLTWQVHVPQEDGYHVTRIRCTEIFKTSSAKMVSQVLADLTLSLFWVWEVCTSADRCLCLAPTFLPFTRI